MVPYVRYSLCMSCITLFKLVVSGPIDTQNEGTEGSSSMYRNVPYVGSLSSCQLNFEWLYHTVGVVGRGRRGDFLGVHWPKSTQPNTQSVSNFINTFVKELVLVPDTGMFYEHLS
jgi:hypothetical protein